MSGRRMGKLSRLKPRVAALPARLRTQRDADGHGKAEFWRPWYSLKRWKVLRWDVFLRDLFTCRWPGCGRCDPTGLTLVADHVEPHRGDPDRFWDPTNVQTLCTSCHNSRKQAEEHRSGPW